MTYAQHTPAPWKASRDGSFDNAIKLCGPNFQGIAGAGNFIARMAWTGNNNILSDDSKAEIEANTRLIEHAPDLFDALRSLTHAVVERNESAMTIHAGYAESLLKKLTHVEKAKAD